MFQSEMLRADRLGCACAQILRGASTYRAYDPVSDGIWRFVWINTDEQTILMWRTRYVPLGLYDV